MPSAYEKPCLFRVRVRPTFNSLGVQLGVVWEARCDECGKHFDIDAVFEDLHPNEACKLKTELKAFCTDT